MKSVDANKAGQNHAELVRAAVANVAQTTVDHTVNLGHSVRRAYEKTQPVVVDRLSKTRRTTEHGVGVALTYAGAFLRTLVARSSR